MITILLQKILEQVKALKTNIENMPKGIIYNATETEIGTYLGEKLYSRVIDFAGKNISTSWLPVTENLTGVKELVTCFPVYIESSNEMKIPTLAAHFTSNYKVELKSYSGNQAVNRIIITYTKVST